MSDLSIELSWQRAGGVLAPGAYSNAHSVRYNDEYTITADAAPDWGGEARHVNPEQALIAAVSSCHMMTFLALAAKAKWPVLSYKDSARAYLGKNPAGKMAVTRIDLVPVITFDTGFEIAPARLDAMQDRAHRYCFVANSLADYVEIHIASADPACPPAC